MKPLLIFDGDCGFCRRWIFRWKSFTGDAVDYAPYQEVSGRFPQIPSEAFQRSVKLIDADGKIYSGAEAVFRTLACHRGRRGALWVYQNIPGFRRASESFYAFVAKNRGLFSKLTRFFWGDPLEPSTYFLSSRIFLKGLGVLYFIAFMSLAVQITGLIGENGILPAANFLSAVRSRYGPQAFWLVPTLAWLNASDFFLQALCAAGALFSILLVFGIAPGLFLFLLWLLYLSLASIGQDFLSFQWDHLLLEAGFLAIFLGPFDLFAKKNSPPNPSPVFLKLTNWLLFRLMFSSGMVKLASHDLSWRKLTALTYHYETQPLPVWTSWYVHQMPVWFHKLSCLGMFAIELGAPFLIFAPRRMRIGAAFAITGLQVLIFATGNYCFFNLLTILLCLLLLDDAFWPRRIRETAAPRQSDPSAAKNWPRGIAYPVAFFIFLISAAQMSPFFPFVARGFRPLAMLERAARPFRSINPYGLFAVMTTSRPEIIIEGSNDQASWTAYEFTDKPGDLKRPPRFVAPHQPRLDWQMWFAALGSYRENPWFLDFCIRLLEGRPQVLRLLRKNPFPDAPPKYIRAVLYDYHFTDPAAKKKTGDWWRRDSKGLYCPVLSLR